MSDLKVLIRLHKHELDEKQRALAGLYAEMTELERKKHDLDRALAAEKAAMTERDEVHFTFAPYAEAALKKRQEFERLEIQLEKRIAHAKESLMETFSELKKFEMTQEERERLEEEERAFKEAQAMDAIGIEGFRRKETE